MKAKAKVKRTRFEARVIRADGRVDDYGVIADSKWGPLGRWLAARRIKRLNKPKEE